MLSIEDVKKLLNDPKLSDEQIKQIRNDMYGLAAIAFDTLKEKKKRENGPTALPLFPKANLPKDEPDKLEGNRS
jgi:hypothetical protein